MAEGRWNGIERPYTEEDVERLRGSVLIEHTVARLGSEKLRGLLEDEPYVAALGALTGGQAVQMAKAGLKAIYLSGWQVAADANLSGQVYPDQSLYPSNSGPALVKRINNALLRADQVDWADGRQETDYLLPIIADAEAGFGGPLHAFELTKAYIEAGAAAVHFEDQLASEKKCGHLGGKVLVPTSQFVRTLSAARLAADVCGVPTVIVARTDALAATLLTSDVDEYDREFLTGERTPEGYHFVQPGIEAAIARALAYAPYADMIWCETSHPDLEEARVFAEAIHERYPGKLLAYNCSPSFNWKRNLSDEAIASFRGDLAALGYRYQFVTLAGFHALAYAPYADMIWCETSHPDLEEARVFAEAIHRRFPGKLLAYNCSPSFNWKRNLSDEAIASFRDDLAALGYRYQFVTLAGFHALNASMFELAQGYAEAGMAAYVKLQQHEFAIEEFGYTATRHQREVGAGYFDLVAQVVSHGESSTLALKGSTEEEQFNLAGEALEPALGEDHDRLPGEGLPGDLALGIDADRE